MSQKRFTVLNSFTLKIIAIICMTIDHIAIFFDTYTKTFPEDIYYTFRAIGRIAFPIFCFLIVEGFFFTHNVKKYLFRLYIFAIISQVPYTLAFHQSFSFKYINIFFQLAIGLSVVTFTHSMINKVKSGADQRVIFYALVFFVFVYYLEYNYNIDYGCYGLLTILVFYFVRATSDEYANDFSLIKIRLLQCLFLALLTYYYFDGIQYYCLASFIFILMYNQKRGPSLKYCFYIYYPIHLLILYILSLII